MRKFHVKHQATIKIEGRIGDAVAWALSKSDSIEIAILLARARRGKHPYGGQRWNVWNYVIQVLENEIRAEEGEPLEELR